MLSTTAEKRIFPKHTEKPNKLREAFKKTLAFIRIPYSFGYVLYFYNKKKFIPDKPQHVRILKKIESLGKYLKQRASGTIISYYLIVYVDSNLESTYTVKYVNIVNLIKSVSTCLL